jgi:hypothetical protein
LALSRKNLLVPMRAVTFIFKKRARIEFLKCTQWAILLREDRGLKEVSMFGSLIFNPQHFFIIFMSVYRI